MKHAKFIAEAKRDPMRIYARPIDVLRDRRLGHLERLEILRTWETEARARRYVGYWWGDGSFGRSQATASWSPKRKLS